MGAKSIYKIVEKYIDDCLYSDIVIEYHYSCTSHGESVFQEHTNYDRVCFLFDRSDYTEYTSYFPLAYRDNLGNFHGYAGSIFSGRVYDNFTDITLVENFDFYICPNGFKTGHSRKSDNLINLQNIVIDIDAHDSTLSTEELQTHIKEFSNKLLQQLRPKPNVVNFSGRGVHLWYCLEPAHVSLKNMFYSAISMLCDEISSIMTDLDEQVLSLDKNASMNLGGLIRLPGSYNTKSKTWSQSELLHDEIVSIDKLIEKLHNGGWKSDYFPSKRIKYLYSFAKDCEQRAKKEELALKKKNYEEAHSIDYTNLLELREKFMYHLFETRNVGVGQRDIMLFAMYSVVSVLYDKNDAHKIIIDLNNGFVSPLSEKELFYIFREIGRKHHRFTVKKFFDFVGATPQEIEWYNNSKVKTKSTRKRKWKPGYIPPCRKKAKENTRIKKEARNKRITELFNAGSSIASIARDVGCSRTTVYDVVGLPFKL